jgi:hypothetical protein
MSDEERIERQMIDPHQERQMSARRMKLWHDTQVFNEQRALEALRGKPQWPERHRFGIRELAEVSAVCIGFALVGGVLAFGLFQLFN